MTPTIKDFIQKNPRPVRPTGLRASSQGLLQWRNDLHDWRRKLDEAMRLADERGELVHGASDQCAAGPSIPEPPWYGSAFHGPLDGGCDWFVGKGPRWALADECKVLEMKLVRGLYPNGSV